MASLKDERARVSSAPRKYQPKPLYIQKARHGLEQKITNIRLKKAVIGVCLAGALTLLMMDYSLFGSKGAWELTQSVPGLFFIVALPLYILYRDLKRYKKTVTDDLQKLVLLCVIIVGAVAVSRFSAEILSTFTRNLPGVGERAGYFAVPVALGAMLATLLFDIHTGIIVSFVMSIFADIIMGGEPLFFVYTFVGSMVASFSVVRCNQRSALLKAGLFVSLANMAAAAILDLYRHMLFTRGGLHDIVAASIGGAFVAVLVSGILPLLESTFKVVTDISLLEYSDLNRPLLRNLMVNAPGTYHHSIIIGSLAEAAAEAVGVNPLMARVSAYYHDIGKIRKPEYFIENQAKGENRHDRLTPSMSSLIISSHVKEGVELARESKLPPAIIDVIMQHHGNALMTFFFEKAKEAEGAESSVREEDYRYPGPRPKTKVAAIVMLSDAVEAASRVLDNPTPPRIAAMVDKIVNRIFEDGQLNDCDLTLRDLTEINRSFNLLLSGIYHHRIDYPGLGIPSGGEKRKLGGTAYKQPEEDKAPAFHHPEGGRRRAMFVGPGKR